MTSQSFAEYILSNRIIGFFEQPMTLKSGRSSHFYVNWRRATHDAFLLDTLSSYLASFVKEKKLNCDTLYGVPEGASKIAMITAIKIAKADPSFSLGSHCIAMGRAQPKTHGDPADRFFIGQPIGATFVVEDTVTTGLSLFSCVDRLIDLGVDVRGVICLTDRCEMRDDGETVAAHMNDRYQGRLSYQAMSRAPDLLRLALKRSQPPRAVIQSLALELGLSVDDLLN